MNLVEFLQRLVIKGWKFWIEDNKLRYRAPKEELVPEVIVQLKQHKTSILQLLQDRPNVLNIYPLSHGQKSLWFLWQLAPTSSAYNQVFTCRICNELNVIDLHLVFNRLLERHPSLRSTFPKLGEEPIQQVHHEGKVDFQQVNASNWSQKELYSCVYQESRRPFNLENELVMRVRLFTCTQEEHILLLTIHHIATDSWSLDLILSDLSKLCKAQQDGYPVLLPSLKNSYFDYVYFQNKKLAGSEGEKLWSYWQDRLKGELPRLNLHPDKPRPTIQTYNGASHNFQLSSQLTQQLKQLALSSDATLYMNLLAAFQIFLYRYTGQEDILVGSPMAGRLQSQFREIVGFFANSVVLRGDLSSNPNFKDFLSQVRQRVLEALTHQDYPFAILVEKLQQQREAIGSPIFQTFFALQQLQKSQQIQKLLVNEIEENTDVNWGGMKLKHFDIPQQEGQFDLTLEMMEGSSSIFGTFKYNTDLFARATIERMAAHFENLLSAIVENPQQLVGELPLLSAADRHQLTVEWNDTATEYPRDKCIHQLFEEQVEKTPDAVAVIFEQEELTYQQLNQRANQLAHHLQTVGVKPEVLVGICVKRSLEMMVGLLGILKAGGAYVPLDPSYPTERLSYLLSDSSVEVLLTQQSLLESLPSHSARVLCLDTDWAAIEQHSQENLVTGVNADNLAYVIYTSGSTGEPKGVQICHSSVVNFLSYMRFFLRVSQEDTFNAVTTISFDIAALELYLPLLVGAKILIVSSEVATDGDRLLSELSESRITVMQATPATWQMLLASGWSSHYPLKVLCGGEALSAQLAHQILETGSELWNLYGPTEVTIWSLIAHLRVATTENKPSSIGRPIANTQVYILDSQLQPVPIGVAGELHIGGDGLARGYLNRPELTESKFIPNPFAPERSARLYKTGDIARYQPDGNIEFLGRIDHQVKIRGFRIELGEIEAVLSSHPHVRQAVAIATTEPTGNQRLVAYVVSEEEELSTQQLREFLQQQLPAYMVPSAFIILDTLPLTPNGKLDRKSLPAPDREISKETEYVAPRNPSEEIIANIFTSVLGVQNVGIHDNFFEMGGHSLTAIQVMSRLNETFQIELPLRNLFEMSTVATLGKAIEAIRQEGTYPVLNPIMSLNLQAEAVLDPTISCGTMVYQSMVEPSSVFLTGATGFLGAFLLTELLHQTRADIYCLVRASTIEAGKQRLQKTLESYLLWEPDFGDRIIPVLGDLSQPLLGLSEVQFQMLASQMDVIYHNGALVNHVYPYALMKAANVQATEVVLRLASQIKIKPVHFISTTSVFSSDAYFNIGVIQEVDVLEHSQGLMGGYVQSKWVAEKLVMMARDRGLPCCIYRFGRISWHSQTGVWNTNDLLYRIIKGCIHLGSVPDFDRMIEITPVDYISKAIVHLSQQQELLGKAFHLVNSHPVPWCKFVDGLRNLGYSLPQIAYTDWEAHLIQNTRHSTDNALSPFVAFAEANTTEELIPHQINSLQFDCQNTIDGLKGANITCPEISEESINIFFSNFVRSQEG